MNKEEEDGAAARGIRRFERINKFLMVGIAVLVVLVIILVVNDFF